LILTSFPFNLLSCFISFFIRLYLIVIPGPVTPHKCLPNSLHVFPLKYTLTPYKQHKGLPRATPLALDTLSQFNNYYLRCDPLFIIPFSDQDRGFTHLIIIPIFIIGSCCSRSCNSYLFYRAQKVNYYIMRRFHIDPPGKASYTLAPKKGLLNQHHRYFTEY